MKKISALILLIGLTVGMTGCTSFVLSSSYKTLITSGADYVDVYRNATTAAREAEYKILAYNQAEGTFYAKCYTSDRLELVELYVDITKDSQQGHTIKLHAKSNSMMESEYAISRFLKAYRKHVDFTEVTPPPTETAPPETDITDPEAETAPPETDSMDLPY